MMRAGDQPRAAVHSMVNIWSESLSAEQKQGLPVKVWPKTSFSCGVNTLGEVVFSTVTLVELRSVMEGLADEYPRQANGANLLTLFSTGQAPNRDGRGKDDARLSIVFVAPRKFR
jgi:hypothetical protein